MRRISFTIELPLPLGPAMRRIARLLLRAGEAVRAFEAGERKIEWRPRAAPETKGSPAKEKLN
jgi:hypothetical protein